MFYVLIALCVVVATLFFARHHAIKTRFVEKEIDKVIARKLAASDYALELSRLREENAVMRNLLLDLIENEAHIPVSQPNASQADLATLRNTKIQRYREILAESLHFLQQHNGQRIPAPVGSYTSAKSEKS
ncbi:hypothetical protein [Aliirhizobium cellulosilyticum]|uniref:Uncharacterized protein n=1 Tax=Aliirhizobium cellulosilyticum TaxID=393664 RepID=A0A7W6WQC9_9HYPH|nr:hypothetical protein [Rhizobium cellulosilyticum]MBB4349277.1 hypothetical protein [Rhizobium cellulosilyticum]MBB4412501.1 hypothetical protein [Rhizobium cellulosilyticum]MBB4447133.1 hypothetical protein [Rhizobium cellulosilyticum]